MSQEMSDFIVEVFRWGYDIATLFILCEIPLLIYVRVCRGRSEVFR